MSLFLFLSLMFAKEPTPEAIALGEYAAATHYDASVTTLKELVAFKTVKKLGTMNFKNENFIAMSAYLKQKSVALGLDFSDHGDVVVIGLGQGEKRLGIITHGDVQPADPQFWKQDPFQLDTETEPGKLLGRGTEDDKGPIATALYAMKTLKEKGFPLKRRIELIISYTEESDWAAFMAFLAKNPPPDLNVAIDAEYPVTIAEKGWCGLWVTMGGPKETEGMHIKSFQGGSFMSQVPEFAEAVIGNPAPGVLEKMQGNKNAFKGMTFEIKEQNGEIHIKARGKSTHSSKPEYGVNAITHLAAFLGAYEWQVTQASDTVKLINDTFGTGYYAEGFRDVAFSHPFMGKLTASVSFVKPYYNGRLETGINLRVPVGRSQVEVERSLRYGMEYWLKVHRKPLRVENVQVGQASYQENAPHVDTLLGVFKHFTGMEDAKPISIGGSTHAKLVPNGVNFGPAMPGVAYTGHSEHEYITAEQFRLNLKMYTAMMAMLAGGE